MQIIVDTREPKNHYEFINAVFTNHDVISQKLDEGDYASDNVIVERKAIGDLYSSILEGRLDSQMARLTCHADKFIILFISGDISTYVSDMKEIGVNINANLLYGYVASLMSRENIIVMWCEDDISGLLTMIKTMEKLEDGAYRVPKRIDRNSLMAKYLGLTIKQYKELIGKYGSINNIANLSVSKLTVIKGIGNKKADKINKLLNGGE